MRKLVLILLVVFLGCEGWMAKSSPRRLRSGIFLHHSTGGYIWGPNGSGVSVPNEIAKYNKAHNLTEDAQVVLRESDWPQNPWTNEWDRWHRIFDNQDTEADIRPILRDNGIIMVKSCFPSSGMVYGKGPKDTLTPDVKTMYNYKWHWRSFIRVMASHKDNFFVVWTNAPLVAKSNDTERSSQSKAFCKWAKDTLARGLDPVFGAFPRNVYVFDLFRKLTDSNGVMLAKYAFDSVDSHPNAAATALIAPQLVQEMFDAALTYDASVSVGASGASSPPLPATLPLLNYPNPFNPSTTITYGLDRPAHVSMTVFDLLGREVARLVEGTQTAGSHQVTFSARAASHSLASGIYIVRLVARGISADEGSVVVRTHRLTLIE